MIPNNAADNYIINQEENFYNFAVRTLTRYGMPLQIATAIAGPLATYIGSRALEQTRTSIRDINNYISEQTAGLSAYATGNLQNVANDIFDQIEQIRNDLHNQMQEQDRLNQALVPENAFQRDMEGYQERANAYAARENELAETEDMMQEDRLANIQRELGASEQVFNGKLISQFTLNYTDV